MIDLTNFDPIKIGDELAELESRRRTNSLRRRASLLAARRKSLAILWDVKQHHPEHLDAICKRAKIGRSRRYELLRIGSGRETAKQSRKKSAKRQTKSRATKKARATAKSVTVTNSAPKAAQGQAAEERYKPAPLERAERRRPGRNKLRTLPPRPLPADRGRPHGGASDSRGCRPRQKRSGC